MKIKCNKMLRRPPDLGMVRIENIKEKGKITLQTMKMETKNGFSCEGRYMSISFFPVFTPTRFWRNGQQQREGIKGEERKILCVDPQERSAAVSKSIIINQHSMQHLRGGLSGWLRRGLPANNE